MGSEKEKLKNLNYDLSKVVHVAIKIIENLWECKDGCVFSEWFSSFNNLF